MAATSPASAPHKAASFSAHSGHDAQDDLGAVAVLLLLARWFAWPFVGLHDLARAAQSGDIARIEQRVDFAALGRSLSGQIVQTYAELAGVPVVRGGLIAGIASAVADPMIARLLSRIALAELRAERLADRGRSATARRPSRD